MGERKSTQGRMASPTHRLIDQFAGHPSDRAKGQPSGKAIERLANRPNLPT